MTRSKAAILGTAIVILVLFSFAGGAFGGGDVPPPAGAPVVLGIAPPSGPTTGGNEVVIEGSGFTGTGENAVVESSGAGLSEACYAWGVQFGGVNALSFTVTSDSRIVAVAPPHVAGTVQVKVTANGVASANTAADDYAYYLVEATPPAITELVPALGPTSGGNTVIIRGTGFVDVGEYAVVESSGAGLSESCYSWGVQFGASNAQSFTVKSATEIWAVAPMHCAETVQVKVTAHGLTSADTAADDYTYEAVIPTVTGLAPITGPTGGGTAVTIAGTGFYGVGEGLECLEEGVMVEACSPYGVTFDGVPAKSFSVKSPTQIIAYSPAHAVGAVQVQVNTMGGSSADTDADDFEYYQAPLAITELVPATGPSIGGNEVIIRGSGFYLVGESLPGSSGEAMYEEPAPDNGVTFGGVPALSYTVYSDSKIKAIAPAGELGTVQVQVNTPAGSTADTSADDYTYDVTYTSILGTDRYSTAIKISQFAFPTGLPADSGMVLAPGESYQEALCGAPLATAFGGPVLLTPKVGLNNAVKAEIIRLKPKYVICIGLSDTIKNAVQTALGATGTATAIRGADVYDLAYKVAKALGAKVGDLSGATAIITRGDSFADAIAAAPLACAKIWPVLLTNGPTGSLHPKAVQALYELGITSVIKVGTYCTLPAGVTGAANLSGADRYFTNRNLAQWAMDHAGLTFSHAGFATGEKFPDALAAGPYLARDDGILLLSPLNGPLPACIRTEFAANAGSVEQTSFFAMLTGVQNQVKGLVP